MKKYFIAVLFFLTVATQSFGAGMTTHMYMSDVALSKISDPELKKILNDNRDAVLAGTIFPDSGNGLNYTIGYTKKDNYASVTHWQPFIEAYQAYVISNCRAPYSSHCQMLIAHFMGSAAHNMEDGTSHTMFQRVAIRKDPGSKKADMDSALDFILIAKYQRGPVEPKYVVPYDDLVKIFQSMGLNYSKQSIIDGNRVHRDALIMERRAANSFYESHKKKMPWAIENIITAPGGIDYSGDVVAKYWEALWQRLNGKEPADMIIAVYPEPGEKNIDPQTELFLMFNRPMQAKTINNKTVMLKDSGDSFVSAEIENHGEKFSELNIFTSIIPQKTLKPNETYTATLTTGIMDLHGKPLPENYSWKFTTAAAAQ